MNQKKIIPCIYLMDGKPIKGFEDKTPLEKYKDAVSLADTYRNRGADALFVLDLTSENDASHEKNVACMREIVKNCDIPVFAGGMVKRFEDIKKYLYTGAIKAVAYLKNDSNRNALEESLTRFGKEKLLICLNDITILKQQKEWIERSCSELLIFNADKGKMEIITKEMELCIIPSATYEKAAPLMELLKLDNIGGLSGAWTEEANSDLMAFKFACKAQGIAMNLLESKLSWSDLKLNSDGMVPVIVQEDKTDEVLMLAYMNEEAFQETIASGKMTYWSRSRNELWKKGLTSGHFQYVRSLTADCDLDTILAKVSQVGAACHTGKTSCFFNEVVKKEDINTNPLKVFEDVYTVIRNRKENPKEGSYTNYLFDKGIDKILKKVGEEAAEIIIAAKNPDAGEIKYEISDFLYHVMVLMVERGVTWEDITNELVNR